MVSETTDSPDDGGVSVLGVLTSFSDNPDDLRSFLRAPAAFIVMTIATWVVTNVFLRPAEFVFGTVDWTVAMATGVIEDAFGTAGASAWKGLTSILELPAMFRSVLAGPLMDAGLAAPIAGAFASALLATVATLVAYLIVRVIADFIPGLGGLLP
ncbi:hypothetical protein E6P09_07610 [Haloferax mediterranei ATCC 33500]|uniref:Uncharacterized protein n=1 Tax=Haloferax mediterranei (strain ATCC 33500 / DSM 1411 / JCM 8866 / NBRC 14739 / NCIMB 2177 / R-4) TaxID=523841 RepID=I3R324_HALMT|nr:hypothetical protein [Haloferax mediterranei]AFK18634.1 hypothetical protein HFX_0913 [Haloferax mediterranei ATCC 33500]AHZ21994.1 hypothetical protein BM92_04650 [Haloferax mediterranei ATCC 33500]EMA02090.1 hypothetical protein C439_05905 [Haloferax mediterranei ATCC 33500]MDX5988727.1 hypothetical protein [Haloferax mediterranei ATCC 33500]QCQ75134.1 hypothetical protein E6P09_07610 [Haloferax mediterranei ATCC 33500]